MEGAIHPLPRASWEAGCATSIVRPRGGRSHDACAPHRNHWQKVSPARREERSRQFVVVYGVHPLLFRCVCSRRGEGSHLAPNGILLADACQPRATTRPRIAVLVRSIRPSGRKIAADARVVAGRFKGLRCRSVPGCAAGTESALKMSGRPTARTGDGLAPRTGWSWTGLAMDGLGHGLAVMAAGHGLVGLAQWPGG